MEVKQTIDTLQRQNWLETAGDYLKRLATTVFDGGGEGKRLLRNSLSGTWLGHPTHPMIVTVPAGAWVASSILDLFDAFDDASPPGHYGRAADATIVVGLVSALGAAASGLNDWRFTSGRSKRIGTLHGLTNVSAVSLMGASSLLRWRGSRTAGQAVSVGGLLLTVAAAYIGGELVYGEHVGVDHATTEGLPKSFAPVVPLDDLPEGKLHGAKVSGIEIVLVRRGSQVHALVDSCAHLGGPLHEGTLDGDCVTCPWHGSRFSLVDGRAIDGPTSYPQPVLETRVNSGQVEVRLKE
ncbi:MAG TPA: Rieske 2Fe-2S domain-containing protein [Nitrolancea sp.]|nr:Rieske 2Fe-2S domain-containing protein [Nitrolancea sp.]